MLILLIWLDSDGLEKWLNEVRASPFISMSHAARVWTKDKALTVKVLESF